MKNIGQTIEKAKRLWLKIQLNEYQTDPNFLQIFQINTTVCLIIYMFCKSCEPDNVLKLKLKKLRN